MTSHLLRIKNAAQLVLVCSEKEKVLKGTAMQNLAILEPPDRTEEGGTAREEGLSIAVDRGGRITAIGLDREVDSRMDGCSFERCIDASGMSVLPGLVDAHTHPVWVGDRVHEFAMKVNKTINIFVSAH